MSRITRRFDALKAKRRKALIPYITAGDPQPQVTVPMLHALVEAGADVIELGVPFSDPMADGPVIQQACERALAQGTGLRQVLRMVLRQGMSLVAIGLVLGLGAALAVTRLVDFRTFLWDVSPTDPVTYLGITGILTAVALVANLVPARRITRIDPIRALREE